MRKLTTAAAVSLALASGGAHALGLGNIEMRSALNQPMDAAITMTSVAPGEVDGMIVQLAPPDAFARAGIERSSVLTDLDFSVDTSGDAPVIRVTSKRPILEPFLNFLVEVDWPQGRLVREYTVLLDPPVFMTPDATGRNTAADTPVRVEQSDNTLLAPAPIDRDTIGLDGGSQASAAEGGTEAAGAGVDQQNAQNPRERTDAVNSDDSTAANPAAQARAEAAEINRRRDTARRDALPEVELLGGTREVPDDYVAGGSLELNPISPRIDNRNQTDSSGDGTPASSDEPAEYEVKRGDTLYEIADATRARSTTVQQMMLALLNANERAFIQRNINLVKAGSILRIPAPGEQRLTSQVQAVAEIRRQADLWREYRDSLRQATRLAAAPVNESSSLAGTDSGTAADGSGAGSDAELSADAQAVLDQAREEIRNRDELQIVADPASTSTTASATADETADSDTQRLGEINRELTLAREELSSSRLAGDDLGEAAAELASTEEKLDSLVNLTQNEVAALEARLAESRRAADADAGEAAVDQVAARSADTADTDAAGVERPEPFGNADTTPGGTGSDAASNDATSSTGAGDSPSELRTGDAGEALANATRDTIDIDAQNEAGQQAADTAASNAGQLVGDGKLLEENAAAGDASADTTAATPPVQSDPWYENLLADKAKLAVAGVGGLGFLGLVGLLMRRRRTDDDFEEIDEVEYIDDDEAGDLQADIDRSGPASAESAAVTAAATSDAQNNQTAPIDHEKVLSEADVYIAYGLHGQAEELLVQAIADDPNNQDYVIKLLETHHAQGNAREFGDVAVTFHTRFGGAVNPSWPAIAAMGRELEPSSTLFSPADAPSSDDGPLAAPESTALQSATDDAPLLDLDADPESSVTEADIEPTEEPADESLLMDESLDPGFAFDESDLEATGDFSAMADEVVAEETPGRETDAGAEAIEFDADGQIAASPPDLSDELAGASLDAPDLDLSGDWQHDIPAEAASSAESVPQSDDDAALGDLDGLDLSTPIADDLTLDIEQLTSDMDLDSAELLSDDFLKTDTLDLPDLDSDNDGLLSAGSDTVSDADDLDTMMDLAKAYIDMGDKDSASSALDEIVKSGNPEQVSEAETLLRKIS